MDQYILWVTTQTQLFYFLKTKKKNPEQGSGLSSLGRIMLKKQGCVLCHVRTPVFAQKLANFPNGLLNDFRLPRRPLMVRAALL